MTASTMKFTEIKAGYRLTVHSWENDGDYDNTVIKDGLSKDEVLFLKPLFELLKTKSRNPGCFGNMFDPSGKQIQNLVDAVRLTTTENIAHADEDWKRVIENTEDDMTLMDYFVETMSDYGLTGGEYYTRVFHGLKIEFVPEAVRIQDVTDQF